MGKTVKVVKAKYTTVPKEGKPSITVTVKPERYHVLCYKDDKIVRFLTRNNHSDAKFEAKEYINAEVKVIDVMGTDLTVVNVLRVSLKKNT